MGNKVTICHWDEGGHWEAIEINTSALEGHDNHDLDIWPPIEDVTEGSHWPGGEAIYLNGCVLETESPEPSPTATESETASPSPTLPETGATANATMALVGIIMIGAGAWMKLKSLNH